MSEKLDSRVTELEIQLAHLQRMFDQLNEVVTEQSKRMDRLQQSNKQLADKLDRMKNASSGGGFDAADDKPPHY